MGGGTENRGRETKILKEGASSVEVEVWVP